MAMYLTGSDNPIETSLSSMLANLPELLGTMMRQGHRVLAVMDFADYRYVQFWAENDLLIGEVISNENIDVEALTADQEAQLVAAGWNAPDDECPNYYFTITNITDVPVMVEMMTHAIIEILQQGSTPELQTVSVKTFDNAGEGVADMDTAREISRVRIVEDWDGEGTDLFFPPFSSDDEGDD